MIQFGWLQMQPPHLGVVQKIVEQLLQPLALALHDLDPLHRPPLGRRLRLFEILGQAAPC